MTRLKVGKIPSRLLKETVFGRLGCSDPSVILGPSIGEDAALIRMGGEVLAFKTDPITGSVDEIGWLAVYVNANDIATRGAVPRWFIQSILMPEGSSLSDLSAICAQIDAAAKEVGVSIVGGHTEVTKGIANPIVVGAMIGTVGNGRFFSTGGGSMGDLLYMTKTAGIEGTAILASDGRILRRFGGGFVARCKALIRQINAVGDCLALSAIDGVTAMHDVTEGGLLGGAWELAEASSSGIRLELRSVPLLEETSAVCGELGLDPYRLIGSGSVLFTVKPDLAGRVEGALRQKGIPFTEIGGLTPRRQGRVAVLADGTERRLEAPGADELWKGLGKG